MPLDHILDNFRSKYAHLEIRPKPIDVTECFRNGEGNLVAPENYGDLEQNVVMLYVIRGAPFIEKYEKSDESQLVRVKLNSDAKVMACLCLRDLQNTSFQEIKLALGLGIDEVQGYKRWHIRNIEEKIRHSYCDFEPAEDTAFLFAGKRNQVYSRTRLSARWLRDISMSGRKSTQNMDSTEAELMEAVFPPNILTGDEQAILEGSYRYGKEFYTPESTEFLKRKVEVYQRFKE